MYNIDGSVMQHSTPVSSQKGFDLRYPQVGVVRKVFYGDDSSSPDEKSLMAIVEITSGGMYVETPPVRFAVYPKYGIENIFEVSPRPSKSTYDQSDYVDKTDRKQRTQEDMADGDIVLVQFINGNPYHGFITNYLSHGDASKGNVPTKEDGERFLFQHQGLRQLIDKEGNYTIESFESKIPEFSNENPKRKMTVKFMDKDGKGVTVTYDNVANSISMSVADGDTTTLTMTKDGLVVTTAKDVNFDGKNINLNGEKVNVGASADKSAVLGEEIMTFLKNFVTTFNTHIHQVPQAPAGTLPSAPPAGVAQNPEKTMLSENVKVKS